MAVEASEGRPLAPRQCSESEARMPPTLEKSLVHPAWEPLGAPLCAPGRLFSLTGLSQPSSDIY